MTPCIEVKGVTVAYDERPVLENVHWTVECGTLAAIIGPNGGGKSTLLRTLVGRLKPLAGEVRVFGQDPVKVRRHISYLPQNEEIEWGFPLRAVDVVMQGQLPHTPWWRPLGFGLSRRRKRRHNGENAANGAAVATGDDPMTRDSRVTGDDRATGDSPFDIAMAALERVHLREHALRPVGDLSGGQRQRVLLARALSQDAKLILLDEPATALDATAQHNLLDILEELRDEGRTVVATTHDLNCLTDCFDTVIGIRGRVIFSGTPEETLMPETLTAVFGRHVPMLTAEGRVTIVEHHD